MKEWTATELQAAYARGETTPLEICTEYLERIREMDKGESDINAVIEVNPDALELAQQRTRELGDGTQRGLLHGVPVMLKDNIDTADAMKTTAGSLALMDAPRPADAPLVKRLREEGAILLAKTNLSEWANFRSTSSSSGWSSRGGQTRNPYVLDRTPCGSSSGSGAAVAANLAVMAVGTETDGSVTCPSAHGSLVGIKPTLGLVSRTGIVPISASQDTAGPMARTVRDAALLLQAMSGTDATDPATKEAAELVPESARDLLRHLTTDFIRGKRIGVARNRSDVHRDITPLFEDALEALRRAGAVIVDPVEMPEFSEAGTHELTVLRYEFRQGLAEYFARRGGSIRAIEDVIAFNRDQAERVMPFFGQEHMEAAADCGPLTDECYLEAVRESRRITGPAGIQAVLGEHRLDAIVAPTNGPAWLIDHVNGDSYTGGSMSTGPAVFGSPHITVPMGYVRRLPVGLSFIADRGQDADLLGVAYGYEQAHPVRRPPQFVSSLGLLEV